MSSLPIVPQSPTQIVEILDSSRRPPRPKFQKKFQNQNQNRTTTTRQKKVQNKQVKSQPKNGPQKSRKVSAPSLKLTRKENQGVKIECERLLRAIGDPINSTQVRWPDEFNSSPTATSNPFVRQPVGFGNGHDNDTSTAIGFVFRNSLARAAVLYDGNSTSQPYQYSIYGSTNGDESEFSPSQVPTPAWTETFGAADSSKAAVFRPMCTPYAVPSGPSSYQPHGPILMAGEVEENKDLRFFWLDDYATLTLNYSSASAFNIALSYWSPDDFRPTYGTLACGLGANQTIVLKSLVSSGTNAGGYYALSINSTTNQAISINSLNIAGSDEVYCHLCAPGLYPIIGGVGSHRTIGSSLMFTNKASEINRQGKIITAQLPRGSYWTNYASASYDQISSLPDSKPFEAKNGCYAFTKPTDRTDFEFKNEWLTQVGVLIDCYYELDSDSPPIVICANISATTGQDAYWTHAYSIEYFTTNQWLPVGTSRVSHELGSTALDQLKLIYQFHENPLHIGEIWNNIKRVSAKAMKFVQDYGPTAVALAEFALPFIGI